MERVFGHVAIPCVDFDRAFKFYYAITEGLLQMNPNVPFPMAYFYDRNNNPVGHLFFHPGFKPCSDGVLVYMELAPDLNDAILRIVKAGGKLVMEKTIITPEKGYWAVFTDTEGNKLALHSMK